MSSLNPSENEPIETDESDEMFDNYLEPHEKQRFSFLLDDDMTEEEKLLQASILKNLGRSYKTILSDRQTIVEPSNHTFF